MEEYFGYLSVIKVREMVLSNPDLYEKYGKSMNSDIFVDSPLQNGIIAEYDFVKSMFNYFLVKVNPWSIFKPKIAVCIPVEMTDVEARALKSVMRDIDAKQVLLFEKPYELVANDIPCNFSIIIDIIPDCYI